MHGFGAGVTERAVFDGGGEVRGCAWDVGGWVGVVRVVAVRYGGVECLGEGHDPAFASAYVGVGSASRQPSLYPSSKPRLYARVTSACVAGFESLGRGMTRRAFIGVVSAFIVRLP